MTETVLPGVLRALELAVIERAPNATFHLVTPFPDWLTSAFDVRAKGPYHTLGEALPFLTGFLPEADAVWRDGAPATLESGPFTATINGTDMLLRARALTIAGRAVLILERLTGVADVRPVLQKAREEALERERAVRTAGTMRAPEAAIAAALARLAVTALSDAQQAAVADIAAAHDRLRAAIADLPMPAPRTPRGGKGR